MRSARRLTTTLSIALVLSILLAACSSAIVAAATVNGHKIKRSDFQRELEAIRGNKAFFDQLTQGGAAGGDSDETISAGVAAGWLTQLITIRLIEEEFERRGLKITDEIRKSSSDQMPDQFGGADVWEKFPKWFRDRMIERIARVTAVEKAFSTAPKSEKDVKKYFDEHPGEFDQFCARHILVDTEDEAKAIAGQLAGGADFAEVAKEKSKDTGSGAKGGDLGCLVKSTYVKPFADALAKAEINKVTSPVKSEFGFHLILVTERKPADFEGQKEEITATLGQKDQQALQEFFTKALEKAKVDVDPRYGKVEKSQQGLRVVPPAVTEPSTVRQDPTGSTNEDPAASTGPVGGPTTP